MAGSADSPPALYALMPGVPCKRPVVSASPALSRFKMLPCRNVLLVGETAGRVAVTLTEGSSSGGELACSAADTARA
jgi:hypothetical protein